MKKVLMVCLGNICRSPMAEGILKSKLQQNRLDVQVDSAGTSDYHLGEAPDRRAIEKMMAHGIDISQLKARQFTVEDYDHFDRIFVMDASNYSNVLELARDESDQKKVDLILNLSNPGSNMAVPDPYFGGLSGFDKVYKLLDQACDKIIEEINSKE